VTEAETQEIEEPEVLTPELFLLAILVIERLATHYHPSGVC
jgi:hypothetical protein